MIPPSSLLPASGSWENDSKGYHFSSCCLVPHKGPLSADVRVASGSKRQNGYNNSLPYSCGFRRLQPPTLLGQVVTAQDHRLVDMASTSTIVRCQATLECGKTGVRGLQARLISASLFLRSTWDGPEKGTVRSNGEALWLLSCRKTWHSPSVKRQDRQYFHRRGSADGSSEPLQHAREREPAACRRKGVVRMHVRSSEGVLLRYFANPPPAQVPASSLISPAWVLIKRVWSG